MNFIKSSSLLFALLLVIACNAQKNTAATNDDAPEPKVSERQQGRQGPGDRSQTDRKAAMEKLIADLGLSAEKSEQLQAIQKKYRGQMQELRKNNEGDRQAMRSSMQEIRKQENAEVKALLSPEQFETYQKWLEDNRPRRGRRPPGGNNR